MPEVEKTKLKDPEPGEETSYDKSVKMLRANIDRSYTHKLVVHTEDREWQQTRQGVSKYFLYCTITQDTVLQDFKVFVKHIKRHSGKHIHQGGVIIYVLEGAGWTVIDGERCDWEAGDMLILPLKPQGVEHQHFNADVDAGCRWLAMLWYPFQVYVASEIHQVEEAPRD